MRIVGGYLGRRRIRLREKLHGIRPTQEKVREAMFNRIEHYAVEYGGLSGKKALDLFAGTGALGLEAISRGIDECIFVERHKATAYYLRQNIQELSVDSHARVIRLNVRNKGLWKMLSSHAPFFLIMADPPYGKGMGQFVLQKIIEEDLMAKGGLLVIEERSGVFLDISHILHDGFHHGIIPLGERKYGDTSVFMWQKRVLS